VSRVFPRRWRLVSSTACSAIALVAVGCGGGEKASDELSRGVGSMLMKQTQEVQEALAAKDFATAREQALDLQDRVTAAIDAGRVPPSLQAELLAAVEDLVRLIPEETPAPEEEEKKDEGEGEDKEKDNGKDEGEEKDKDKDEESATDTLDDVNTVAETNTVSG
jgi:hypothetical protein